jgi:hypothetical protein
MTKEIVRQNILACGIPGSGKTTYCQWLEKEKGFLHLDLDELEKDNGTEQKLALRDCLRHSAERFLRVIAQMDHPIAIDWGFPPDLLGMVTCLNANGFAIWWFDGDRHAARESFMRRGTVPAERFDAQMKSIEEHWHEIEGEIEDNRITAVSAGPSYPLPEFIYRRMFPPGQR